MYDVEMDVFSKRRKDWTLPWVIILGLMPLQAWSKRHDDSIPVFTLRRSRCRMSKRFQTHSSLFFCLLHFIIWELRKNGRMSSRRSTIASYQDENSSWRTGIYSISLDTSRIILEMVISRLRSVRIHVFITVLHVMSSIRYFTIPALLYEKIVSSREEEIFFLSVKKRNSF